MLAIVLFAFVQKRSVQPQELEPLGHIGVGGALGTVSIGGSLQGGGHGGLSRRLSLDFHFSKGTWDPHFKRAVQRWKHSTCTWPGRQHGLIADQLLAAKVALANGSGDRHFSGRHVYRYLICFS